MYDLNFYLHIQCDHDYESFLERIQKTWDTLGITWTKPFLGFTEDNWIELDENDEYMPSKINDVDGYLYYRYSAQVVAKKSLYEDSEGADRQVVFARQIISRTKALDCQVKLACHPSLLELINS